jgi:phosphatidate cytidylyltransferase
MADLSTVHIALLGLWAVLFIASAAVFVFSRIKPERDHSELIQRTKSWWVMIAIFTVAQGTGPTAGITFLCLLSFLALKEYFSMIPTRRADRRVLFWAYLAIPLQYYWAHMGWYGMFIIFIPVYMFLLVGLRLVIAQQTEGFLKSAATIHWGLMTCVFSLSHAAFLLTLPDLDTRGGAGGAGLMFYLIALTQFNDVAQYVWGRSFGGKKILPVVSPKKTWAGFIGGIASTAIAAAVIAPWLTPFDMTHALVTGLIIGTFGFIGDVSISAVKRDIGVKDFGSLIPGHGGILDRIDSLTFVAPLFFHYTWYFFY